MADPLTELKTDLEVLAKPNLGHGATEQEVLKTVQALFKMLGEIEVIKPVVEALTTAIDTGFDEVAGALKAIASHVKGLGKQTGNNNSPLTSKETAEALTGLQNALSTASTLIPAGKGVTTVGGPFLALLAKLLEDVSFEKAAETLEEIAQQLEAIGKAL